ncbi:MAG: hypothetical protein KBA26_13020, partial [Candidatus Delongbacteria bacterium]|nr:hypothetical protein [Candidatus Delongbacteria bacterium]
LPVVMEIKQFIPHIVTFKTGDARDLAEKLNDLADQLFHYESRIEENYAGATRFNLNSMTDRIVALYEK